jgi:hypothetical protein
MYFLTPEQGKPVKAEYTKIGSQTVGVIVWADRPTLDLDPKVRRRVCDAVVYDMKKHLPKARFVPVREVETLQERSGLDWEALTHEELCKRLKCDILLRVDLLEYTSRGSEARELRKGRVRATVHLYECNIGAGDSASYQTEVDASYPGPMEKRITDLSDAELLREAVTQFGQAVARKFYDHEVSYHGPEEK